jgi:cephalosporin hydroxylase
VARALDEAARRRFFERLVKHTNNFDKVSWMGVPVWQNVFDLWTIQETIAEIRPDVLIETGTNRGGSSMFYAQIFDMLYGKGSEREGPAGGRGRIWTVDIERLHEFTNPRVTYHLGSSVSAETLASLRAWLGPTPGRVMVILDSDHNKPHVRAELEAYAPFVTLGSYLLCQDGVIDDLAMFHKNGEEGPRLAVEDFFATSPLATDFEIDHERCERFLITHHPKGWLRRVR